MSNVAYGSGTHVCIGEYLSLVELECAFRGLFTRLPNLKVGHTRVVVTTRASSSSGSICARQSG